MQFLSRLTILLLLILTATAVEGQRYSLEIVPLDADELWLKKNVRIDEQFNSDAERKEALQDLLLSLQGQGYLAASFDKLEKDSLQLKASLHKGEKYKWAALRNKNIEDNLLGKIGFKEKFFLNKPFRYGEVSQIQQKLLTWSENNGYPFATTALEEVNIIDNQFSAALSYDPGSLVVIDSIIIDDEVRINRQFIRKYLGIQEGDLYAEEKIAKISTRIRELPFLEQVSAPTVVFSLGKAKINLAIKNKKASKFDLIIGFLPNNSSTGKLNVTGEGQLALQNMFGAGELIDLEFNKVQTNSKRLETNFNYPFIPYLPIGADLSFDLFIKDTSYLDIITKVGLQYIFSGNNFIRAFVENNKTNVLNVNESTLIQSRSLPKIIDNNNNLYGVEVNYEKLDYRLNPSRGWAINASAAAGTKRIRRNGLITNIQIPNDTTFSFESLYDSLQEKSTKVIADLSLSKFWSLGKRHVLLNRIAAEAVFAEEIFDNELNRIGGTKKLRGFDEESINTSLHSILTLEYRFLLSQNSYFYAFGDYAYVENQSLNNRIFDRPYGFGVGMTFETGAGIFGLSYAMGSQQSNPVDFRTAKFHFGYVNFF